ncbi:MAG: isoprenylcysteine carboxylmethyltransferase family protein [Candidatus Heimdallarchaeota archaeon]|nr:isoprenylcysteine carboxylmethyltransferase family protein [Candidatus Heimdallarchaeota archaeon]
MSQITGFNLLKEKVPEFRNPLKMGFIITLSILVFCSILILFWLFDSLGWYGTIISQLILVIITIIFFYGFAVKAKTYREKYEVLAYRYFFFHYVIPVLITGNACIFHTLLIEGPFLLHSWIALIAGIFFILMRFLIEWHLRKAGFDEIGHGLGIYMIFPEEGSSVTSDIYSYIRHPMYTGDMCLAIGLALLKNNLLAIIIALMSFIPFIVGAMMEDRELIRRLGELHRQYINETPSFFPYPRNIRKLICFLFSITNSQR